VRSLRRRQPVDVKALLVLSPALWTLLPWWIEPALARATAGPRAPVRTPRQGSGARASGVADACAMDRQIKAQAVLCGAGGDAKPCRRLEVLRTVQRAGYVSGRAPGRRQLCRSRASAPALDAGHDSPSRPGEGTKVGGAARRLERLASLIRRRPYELEHLAGAWPPCTTAILLSLWTTKVHLPALTMPPRLAACPPGAPPAN
jgi:hypothetical protein